MVSVLEEGQIISGGYICSHLIETNGDDPYKQFTGLRANYNLVCTQCAKNLDDLTKTLRPVSKEQFEQMDRFPAEGIIGEPEVLERSTSLSFVGREMRVSQPLSGKIQSIAPRQDVTRSQWIALLSNGTVVQIDLDLGTVFELTTISSSTLQLTDSVIHLSPDNRFAAVVNDREPLGVVIDLNTGTITMRLDRGTYHAKQTRFPVAFFQYQGRCLLVHATAWNRLDISDPSTGELLTTRVLPTYDPSQDERPPEHDLNYFHALPVISPNASWIAEDGWVWQPSGVTRLWSLQRWISQNVWESEDGESLKHITQRGYYWNGALCWIDDQSLAVWGFGDDDLWLVPAVQIFNAETGKRVSLFAGPQAGHLYFDEYLFSISNAGTDVWDVTTGERVLQSPTLIPISFHPKTHQFLSIVNDDTFLVSWLSLEK